MQTGSKGYSWQALENLKSPFEREARAKHEKKKEEQRIRWNIEKEKKVREKERSRNTDPRPKWGLVFVYGNSKFTLTF